MKARPVLHSKDVYENGDIIEIKIWEVPASKDKKHGFKYSLAYIVNGRRIVGYDNGEQKGDHRHVRGKVSPYRFKDIDRLFEDFKNDIKKVRRRPSREG
jgi:hypothetical protein